MPFDRLGRSALHYAALNDRPFIAWLLIRRGSFSGYKFAARSLGHCRSFVGEEGPASADAAGLGRAAATSRLRHAPASVQALYGRGRKQGPRRGEPDGGHTGLPVVNIAGKLAALVVELQMNRLELALALHVVIDEL